MKKWIAEKLRAMASRLDEIDPVPNPSLAFITSKELVEELAARNDGVFCFYGKVDAAGTLKGAQMIKSSTPIAYLALVANAMQFALCGPSSDVK